MKANGVVTLLAVLAWFFASTGKSYGAPVFTANTSAASGTRNLSGVTDTRNSTGSTPVSNASTSTQPEVFIDAGVPYGSARGFSLSSAYAQAGALHGSSRAHGEAIASKCCATGQGHSSSFTSLSDAFTLHSNRFADGTAVTMNVLINISGSVSGSGTGPFWGSDVFWRASETVNGQNFTNTYAATYSSQNPVIVSGNGAFGSLFLPITVVLGQTVPVKLILETEASAHETSSDGLFYIAEFSSDLSHTLAWEGINAITINGVSASLSDFTGISVDTGFDFVKGFSAQPNNPVPEPSTWALTLFGILLAARTARGLTTKGEMK